MALEDLTPAVRLEEILDGQDIEPATRLEYFLKKAAEGGGGSGSVEYEQVLDETTKSVSSHWVSAFSGGPIFEDVNYRVIVNGTTYEPLTGTAGELGFICLGNTYVDDSDPSGDYDFGIFYKNNQLSAWLETGDSMTMQIDQIVQLVPVPSPTAADTGKVLRANNGAAEWKPISNDLSIYLTKSGGDYTAQIVEGSFSKAFNKIYQEHINPSVSVVYYNNEGFEFDYSCCLIGSIYAYVEDNVETLMIGVFHSPTFGNISNSIVIVNTGAPVMIMLTENSIDVFED